jgi:peroxiredoxin
LSVIRKSLILLLGSILLAAPPGPTRISPPFPIHLTPGEVSLAQYKGKVIILAMIMTGCPHCQATVQFLTDVQTQYGKRGLQVLGAAFNEDASKQVAGFIQTYKPSFPVGWVTRGSVVKYLGKAENEELWVPVLVFIDKKGVIRHLHFGDDAFFHAGDTNIRAYLEEMLK